MSIEETEIVKCGFVALVGPPNSGKSTLLNRLLGQKISIVSAKPQTTRNRIQGILNGSDYQIILLDTPGLHQADRPLNEEMVRISLQTLGQVDLVLFIVEAAAAAGGREKAATRYLEGTARPSILLLNKIDLVPREQLLPAVAAWQQLYPFDAIIPISALTGDGIDRLVPALLPRLPSGPRLYPPDIPTDASERFIVAEMIREKIFRFTGQEVPYSAAVVVDSFKEEPERGMVTIHATIFIEKDSQKGIIIGRQGAKLKEIGSRARRDIEELLDQRVLLKLWVKVRKGWTRDARFLKELGM